MENQPEYVDAETPAEGAPTPDDAQTPGIAEQTVTEPGNEPTVEGDDNDIPDELPEDPAKQREAFIKMRQKLKQQQAVKPNAPVTPMPSELPQDGNFVRELRQSAPMAPMQLDPKLDMNDPYNKAVVDPALAAQRAAQQAAHQTAALAARIEDMEAESSFPQLKEGSEQYDPMFSRRVEEKYVFERMNAASRNLPPPTVAQVAAKVQAEYGQLRTVNDQASQQRANKQLEQKQQAAFDPRPTSTNLERAADTSQLRAKVNRNDPNALTQLLLEEELSKFSEKDLGFQ